MKLVCFGPSGGETPGIFFEERIYDVSAFTPDFNEAFFDNAGVERLREFFSAGSDRFPVVSGDVRLGSPVARPSKIICIGLNYTDHAKETNAPLPKEPIVFFKATSALNGPNDPVVIPHGSEKTDWEVELAVVVGRKATYVSEENAAGHIAGFCLHNDYSERAFQIERGGQWVKGKSCDTFAPLGPYLVTPDEVGDADNLRLWLSVNDKVVQDSNTKNLVFKVPFLISYLSQFMTLLPGDIISTGTPSGVGLGFVPPVYLKAGDVVELGIDRLGVQKQRLENYTAK